MKTKNVLFILLLGLITFAASAQSPTPASTGAAGDRSFEVRFSIPLSTGDDFDYEVIDSVNAQATNVDQLKAVIMKLLEAMAAGKIAVYPTKGGEDSENNPMTYFNRLATSMNNRNKGPVTPSSLGAAIDCRFTGLTHNGHSTLSLQSVEFTHEDPNGGMLSFLLFALHPKDLAAYKVGHKSLVAYLEGMKYECFLLDVTVDGVTTVMEDLDHSVKLRKKVERGDLSGL